MLSIMKKILLLMAFALPFVFISCDDDKDEPSAQDGHEYVDLGLPSGTMWATCNIGANTPEEYGDYFSWGETAPKDLYDCTNYKWWLYEATPINDFSYLVKETWYKYYSQNWTDNGTVDGDFKTMLDPEDDAAYVNWGPKWRTPSLAQIQELMEKCNWEFIQRKGVNGYLVTGPNRKSIFLPASGGYSDKIFNDRRYGYYWSRMRCSPNILPIEAADQGEAYIMFFSSSSKEVWYDHRYDGIPVRPVRDPVTPVRD